jgi:serine/threonine protein phosphatase PrpC
MAAPGSLKRSRGARSETGYVRSSNEDRMDLAVTPLGDVYVVSDGVGGCSGGALAAEITVLTLKERLSAASLASPGVSDEMRQAFRAANAEVFRRRKPGDPLTCNMGATGVALLTNGSQAIVGHVGDSRAYLWRRRRGLTRLTRDHTKVQRLLDEGLVSESDAKAHPDASVLDRAIGNQPEVDVDVSQGLALKSGDMILLCTDGLCGYVDDAEITQVLKTSSDPKVLVDRLIDAALRKGGEDNVTVQLVRFGATPARWLEHGGPVVAAALGAAALVAWLNPQTLIDTPPGMERVSPEQQVASLQAANKMLSAQVAAQAGEMRTLQDRIAALEPPGPVPTPTAAAAPVKGASKPTVKKNLPDRAPPDKSPRSKNLPDKNQDKAPPDKSPGGTADERAAQPGQEAHHDASTTPPPLQPAESAVAGQPTAPVAADPPSSSASPPQL